MTKARAPLSIAQAVTKVAGLIGWDKAASAVGRKERIVRLWSEPDKPSLPSLEQSILLDAAYIVAGGDGVPIGDAYMRLVGVRSNELTACHDELAATIADASREVGDGLAHAVLITRPGACDAAVQRAIIEVEEGAGKMARLGSLLSRFLTTGAGPGAGSSGGAR